MRLSVIFVVLSAAGCAGSSASSTPEKSEPMSPGPPAPSSAPVPEAAPANAGGALGSLTLTGPTVVADGARIVATGVTEVPEGSRMQMAWAMADAVARAELAKYVRTRVMSLELDLATEDHQELAQTTSETVSEKLPGTGPLEHGWQRVEVDGKPVLRLYARVSVTRQVLAEMLSSNSRAQLLAEGLCQPPN